MKPEKKERKKKILQFYFQIIKVIWDNLITLCNKAFLCLFFLIFWENESQLSSADTQRGLGESRWILISHAHLKRDKRSKKIFSPYTNVVENLSLLVFLPSKTINSFLLHGQYYFLNWNENIFLLSLLNCWHFFLCFILWLSLPPHLIIFCKWDSMLILHNNEVSCHANLEIYFSIFPFSSSLFIFLCMCSLCLCLQKVYHTIKLVN